jgi:5-methylcytosine-specific restriction endonuclease McrA
MQAGQYKRCGRCREELPLDDFNRRGASPDGRQGYCRECAADAGSQRYEANRDEMVAALRARTVGRRRRRRRPLTEDERRERRRRRYLDYRTLEQLLRAVLFERDGGQCWICGAAVAREDFHIDHVQPLSDGGMHDAANLRIAHPECNMRKAARLLIVAPETA